MSGNLDNKHRSRQSEHVRRQRIPTGRRDTVVAMKAALDHLARARGVNRPDYPDCLRLYADMRDEADRWVVRGVRDAIEAGCTWAEVGTALGVSRQAAHERYAPQILALARDATDQSN
jgi:hypothetical protein